MANRLLYFDTSPKAAIVAMVKDPWTTLGEYPFIRVDCLNEHQFQTGEDCRRNRKKQSGQTRRNPNTLFVGC
ncbi:unnamed protein product [Allacma fusca]|uniref:Uncharacterized protein n=1 Tax=Allacma fusca TaxID=39272 RepID=A0A8J2PI71_9HEXA|nr:unnamed protein product [Allacma fusca]